MSEKPNTLVVVAVEVTAEEDSEESRQAAANKLLAQMKDAGIEATVEEIDELEEEDGDEEEEKGAEEG